MAIMGGRGEEGVIIGRLEVVKKKSEPCHTALLKTLKNPTDTRKNWVVYGRYRGKVKREAQKKGGKKNVRSCCHTAC